MRYNLRLLAASYKKPSVIELYGKTDDGKSIVVLYDKFKPYFYVVEELEQVKKILSDNEDVLKIEQTKLYVNNELRNCTKVTIKEPWRVPEYRNKIGRRVLAADIPYAQRFIYDFDMGSCIEVDGEATKGNYTTELVVEAENIKSIEPFNPELKLLSFDLENSIKNGTIYTICAVVREKGEIKKYRLIGSEKEIIEKFVRLIENEDPDIITGYNIDGYDIPILLSRAKENGINEINIGRDLSGIKSVSGRFWRAHGRIIADAWWNAKIQLHPKKETLAHIAKILLGEEKKDVEPLKIDEEWLKDKDKVLEYCEKDAELALKILEKIKVIDKSMDLATVAKLPLDDVLNGRTSTLIDSILIREADKRKIGVEMTKHERERGKILGGYVKSISPGLYNWVCVLDFKSMYPSLIIAKNICFTTLSSSGTIISPTGTRFLHREKKIGLVPTILEKLMSERENTKKKIALALNEGNKEKAECYDRLQEAIKILMNSFYGVFASSFYRFTNRDIGASITGFARENIKKIIADLENEGINVIYSDTDSLFLQSPEQSLGGAIEFGKEISKRFSKSGVFLEFEKVLNPFFSHGKKKRYVGKVVWPKSDTVVRGYEIRRSDAFDYQSYALEKVFSEILNNRIESAIEVAKELVASVRRGEVDIEKLVISRTSKEESFYTDADKQAQVQTAKKMKAMGYEFIPGMKVSWIVTNGRVIPQKVEPYIDGVKFTSTPDWDYYAKRVALSLSRITEVFDWNEKTLLTGIKEKKLEDFG
ncbi:MAG: family B DNA polymerase [Candidatus Thermoplasmatota archaeon]